MIARPIKAIIFDLDGLVLDTESTYSQAWQDAATLMGYVLSPAFVQSLSGLEGKAVEQALLAYCGHEFDLKAFYRLSSRCWHDSVQEQGIQVKTGLAQLLAVIEQHALPFCLATNSAAANARDCLALAGLATTFPLMVSRDDVSQGKPSPAIFLKAAQLLQQPIQYCWVLEDSLVGIAAAQAAGAMPVFVPSTMPLSEARQIAHVTVLADLAQVARLLLQSINLS
jgi:beta-phosphoglucomutase